MTALLIMTDVWLEVWLPIYIESLWQHCDTPKLNIRTVLQSTLLFLLNTKGRFIGRPLLNTLFRRYDAYHHSKRARDGQPMLVQCWAIVYDAGPTLHQHWLNVDAPLRCQSTACAPLADLTQSMPWRLAFATRSHELGMESLWTSRTVVSNTHIDIFTVAEIVVYLDPDFWARILVQATIYRYDIL